MHAATTPSLLRSYLVIQLQLDKLASEGMEPPLKRLKGRPSSTSSN